jgi:hypothetical protein
MWAVNGGGGGVPECSGIQDQHVIIDVFTGADTLAFFTTALAIARAAAAGRGAAQGCWPWWQLHSQQRGAFPHFFNRNLVREYSQQTLNRKGQKMTQGTLGKGVLVLVLGVGKF